VSGTGSADPIDAPDHDRIRPGESITLDEHRRFHFVPARIFSSAADAPRARRPTDWLLLIISALALVLVTIPAPGPTSIDTAVADFVQAMPGLFGWFWEVCSFLLVAWAGVPAAAALSTAIAFRLVTFSLPPLWGSPATRWLRTHSYV
jgi:hypothetical protein